MSTNKHSAVEFLKLAASGHAREAYARFAGEPFRHHNPHFGARPEALIDAMDANARQFPDKRLDVKLVLEDEDKVAVLSHVRHTADEAGFGVIHIFRFADDRIVELWDLAQEVPVNSPNTNGMF